MGWSARLSGLLPRVAQSGSEWQFLLKQGGLYGEWPGKKIRESGIFSGFTKLGGLYGEWQGKKIRESGIFSGFPKLGGLGQHTSMWLRICGRVSWNSSVRVWSMAAKWPWVTNFAATSSLKWIHVHVDGES
jgi:hypothetical protein